MHRILPTLRVYNQSALHFHVSFPARDRAAELELPRLVSCKLRAVICSEVHVVHRKR